MFALIGLTAALVEVLIAHPLIGLAVALLALVTWPAHLGRRVVLPEAVRRPQAARRESKPVTTRVVGRAERSLDRSSRSGAA